MNSHKTLARIIALLGSIHGAVVAILVSFTVSTIFYGHYPQPLLALVIGLVAAFLLIVAVALIQPFIDSSADHTPTP